MKITLNSDGLQSLLREELTRRIRVNPKYSLRAFARHLDLSPSYISLVLNGKRKPEKKALHKLITKLGIETHDTFVPLTEKTTTVISDWYHYAIMELLTIPKFNPSPIKISEALGITNLEAKLALERLLELGLIKKTKNNRLELSSQNNTNIDTDSARAARKNMQRQFFNLALRALDEVSFEQRDHSSMTMALDSKRLTDAKNLIKEFRRKFCEILQTSKTRDSVYTLNIALYPHYKSHKETKK
jgi:transcriptional regulator with XRE-family HTH domain